MRLGAALAGAVPGTLKFVNVTGVTVPAPPVKVTCWPARLLVPWRQSQPSAPSFGVVVLVTVAETSSLAPPLLTSQRT